jgi:hypothetical protein
MPGPDLGFTVLAGPEWERVIAALGRVDAELPGRLRDAIEDDAEKLADVARGRVLGLPTPRNAGHTGLRAKVAAGVHVVRQGTGGVRVQTSMPTRSEGIIPRGLDRPKGWRHPLFGDKNHWYSNPGYDWFLSTFSHSEDLFERDLKRVLERAADNVADAGGLQI